ncbi:MAG TPA: DUF927 domain-containing protein, partial [Burkholderiaceae bacterium]|nr:DUF927 domain-containing protein [Burkholderiaceae bacterium]
MIAPKNVKKTGETSSNVGRNQPTIGFLEKAVSKTDTATGRNSVAPTRRKQAVSKGRKESSDSVKKHVQKEQSKHVTAVTDVGESGLPSNIIGCYRVVDENGCFADSLIIRAKTSIGTILNCLLKFSPLLSGGIAELQKFCFEHSIVESVTPKHMRQLAEQIVHSAKESIRVITSDGFHRTIVDGEAYECFVWARKQYWIGEKPSMRVLLIPSARSPNATCTLDQWNNKIGIHVVNNPNLLVTHCAALSSLLTRWLGLSPVVLYIVGASSTGKSTSQKVIGSIIQRGSNLKSASGTQKGLRAMVGTHTDCPVFLDEARQAENVSDIIGLIFDVVNQASRFTSTVNQQVNAAQELSCGLIISN